MTSYQGTARRAKIKILWINTAIGLGCLGIAYACGWHAFTMPPGSYWAEIGYVCALVFATLGARELAPLAKWFVDGGFE